MQAGPKAKSSGERRLRPPLPRAPPPRWRAGVRSWGGDEVCRAAHRWASQPAPTLGTQPLSEVTGKPWCLLPVPAASGAVFCHSWGHRLPGGGVGRRGRVQPKIQDCGGQEGPDYGGGGTWG